MTNEEQKEFIESVLEQSASLYDDLHESDKGRGIPIAHREAQRFVMSALPTMTSRRETQLYIATVTAAFGAGWVNRDTLKACLHAAQLALASFGTGHAEPEPAKRRVN